MRFFMDYELAIIGAGPAGFSAAIYAKRSGSQPSYLIVGAVEACYNSPRTSKILLDLSPFQGLTLLKK